jgi:hypothetical protein
MVCRKLFGQSTKQLQLLLTLSCMFNWFMSIVASPTFSGLWRSAFLDKWNEALSLNALFATA